MASSSDQRETAALTPSQIAIVKSTAPVLKEHGEAITTLFYNNMLQAHPELHNIFNKTSQKTGAQPRALAAAVFAYASYVDDLAKLSAAVERIAHKHVSLTVQPEQYAIVGKYLIEAVATVLGDAVTAEVAEAWTVAYNALAHVFIGREKQMYAANEEWEGWRRFKIEKKVPESKEITSFYLKPGDGQALPLFLPGQYISLRMSIPELGHMQPRQYSLSEAPGKDYYRISVKKEAGKAAGMPGLISNMLHDKYNEGDVVEITHPAGEFFVDVKDFFVDDIKSRDNLTPIVLISAGVGITPMVSILNSLVAAGSTRPVSWIHGTHSSEVQAFRHHIRDVYLKLPNVDATVFKNEIREGEVQGVDYHFNGRIDLDKVDREKGLFLGNGRAEYYVCGPAGFMKDIRNYLTGAGVGNHRTHLEVFGVGDGE